MCFMDTANVQLYSQCFECTLSQEIFLTIPVAWTHLLENCSNVSHFPNHRHCKYHCEFNFQSARQSHHQSLARWFVFTEKGQSVQCITRKAWFMSLSIWKHKLKSSNFAPLANRFCLLPSSLLYTTMHGTPTQRFRCLRRCQVTVSWAQIIQPVEAKYQCHPPLMGVGKCHRRQRLCGICLMQSVPLSISRSTGMPPFPSALVHAGLYPVCPGNTSLTVIAGGHLFLLLHTCPATSRAPPCLWNRFNLSLPMSWPSLMWCSFGFCWTQDTPTACFPSPYIALNHSVPLYLLLRARSISCFLRAGSMHAASGHSGSVATTSVIC